jgi:UDP-N-acetylglucosamine 3-dehydrogenase
LEEADILAEPVNIGVIGAGYWGKKVVNEYLALSKNEENVSLLRVCDVYEKNLRMCREAYHISKNRLVKNYKEILYSEDVNAVHICTPNETHYEACREALMAGKHVLIEKPMTLNSQEAFELLRLAEKEKLVLQVGYIFRFNNALRRVQKLIKNGFFGDLYYLRLIWATLMQPTPERDIIFDLGPHPVDVSNFLLETWPSKVFCSAKSYTRKQLPEVAYATLEFGEGTLANIELSWLLPKKERSVLVVGSKRSANVDCLDQTVRIFENHDTEPYELEVVRNNTILDELDNFVNHIRGASEPVNSGEVGPINVSVLEHLKKSSVEGETVKVKL